MFQFRHPPHESECYNRYAFTETETCPTNSSPSNRFLIQVWAILLYPTVTIGATTHCDQEHMKMTSSCKGYQKMVETQEGERAGEGRTWVSATVKRWLLTCVTAGSDTGWRSLNDHVIPEWWHSGLNWVCSCLCVTLLLLKQTAASRKLPNHSDTTSGRFYGDSSQDHRVWCLFVLVCRFVTM